MKRLPAWMAGALVAVFATAAHAGGIEQLRAFHATTKSGNVGFKQSVASKGQQQAQRESSGTFSFQRPGKFRWLYTKPFEQLIVGDGERVWVYDRDLNQVVVRKLDIALGSTPAALLAGDVALEENFVLLDGGTADGLEYVEAKPRAPDTGFTRVRIGFAQSLPRAMQLTDAFGNVTTLTFSDFDRNPKVDPSQFKFTPPKGADVVGDTR